MNHDDERDYAEEAANRALLHEEDTDAMAAEFGLSGHKMDYQAFAERALEFYRLVAHHPLTEICASSTDTYEGAKTALMAAIALAYPDIEEIDIYETSIDSGENLAYCAQYVRDHGKISLRR